MEKKSEWIAIAKLAILLNNPNKKLRSLTLRPVLLLAFLIGMPFLGYTQQYEIKGTIKDSLGQPVSNAIIIASLRKNESNVIAYDNSNASGQYKLILENDSKSDSLWLVARYMSYETVRSKVPFKNLTKDFELYPRAEQLKEVLLESPKKVRIKGDTITYNVEGIKAEKDYTIEEAINRIPGVVISESGQIRYKDKAISHLYINGVDLLEGRYNIATQGIPAEAVKEIDIMTNHNHERIDIDRTESDKVAFNLKIKEEVGLVFGSAKAEAGIPWITGLLEATPIYLKDKFQDISSFRINNTGETLRNTGNSLTTPTANIASLQLSETAVIRPTNVRGLILSDKYWLDNESHAATNDALHKINDSTVLKWNVSYLNELSRIENTSTTKFLLNNDSIVVANRSRKQLRTKGFQTGLDHEINKRKFYFKNTSVLRFSNDAGNTNAVFNNNAIQAHYHKTGTKFSNSTILKTLIAGKNILQSGLIIEFGKQSEQLQVIPPVFPEVLGNTTGNQTTLQDVNLNKINIAGSTNYAFEWLKLKWDAQQKLQYNNFTFRSQLRQTPETLVWEFPFSSNSDYQKLSSTSKINSKLNLGKLRFTWNLSGDFISVNTKENKAENLAQHESFLFVQPYFSARYKISRKWNLGISYDLNNSISDFSQLYQPVILKDYNSIVQNPQVINRLKSQSLTPALSYSNVLNSFFFTLRGRINQSESDVTFSNQLNDEGFIFTEVIERPNSSDNFDLSLNLTKGFLGSFNADLSYRIRYTEQELFFNSQFLDAYNHNHNFDFGLSWDNNSWYTLEYDAELNLGTTLLNDNRISNVFLFQNASLDFYTSPSTRLHFGVESARTTTSSSNNINNNTLLNMSFFYKPSKKLFFKASLFNIFDTSYFSTTFSNANAVNISQFSLRPRQFTLGLTYSL